MRRFRILDALFITAAVAAAFAINHWLRSAQVLPKTTLMKVYEAHTLALLVTSTVTWMLGALVLADRSQISNSVRSPGKLTVVSVTAVSLASIAMNWEILFRSHLSPGLRIALLPFAFLSNPSVPACTVISVWLTQFMAGLKRPSSDWLNISGCAIGILWILYAIAHPLLDLEVMRWMGVTT
ncbi:hypothetical protein LOC67_27105 [Stieleria sp. JC731]|uniref:hypothetical protein n=1 Tax=Stieleria sp. JC731 TaxID=2894195 RepID=UPI001E5373A3|nr:hypothetical protein [Stieleria sp. JC731]MCC9604239.1 hypothetical protein [Stieleria sp. JC731]